MGNLRIISGKAKGMRIQSVPGDSTRPITDRVKESLFNIIGADIHQSSFLDLFGGTGSVGIEALSRNAAFVRVIDLHPLAIKTIKANLIHTKLEENAQVIRMDSLVYLGGKPDKVFDFIYIAPPQYKELWIKTMEKLDKNHEWLHENGCIVVQIHPVEYQKLSLHNFTEFDQRKYGSTLLIFYEKMISPSSE
ncbi:MAG: 16S rRNA (guanine(966)-N(2))-methyltransferase RsmD [Chloroflexi bacterium HGW-Chloroflexi-10]|nr:MAG: 16S rRNA (guanine(966)-N(2))-methyltransferase RsmD [Chloroflexi bacterium HGW-Chloroflexi-10]